jgi:hypothetical protein
MAWCLFRRLRLRDEWGHKMLRAQQRAPGPVDGQWTPQMIEGFNECAAGKGSKLRRKPPETKRP